ncbi:MAG: response regulator [Candidatus Heimdallarchaeota archaeon]|nr:response regulator [Candidatus Heimdallarchaeota archaeon]
MTSILVVDDDPEVVEGIVNGLRRKKIDASGETDPARAGAASKNQQFDLILVDIHMPPYSGIRVVMDVAAYAPESKVMIMSGKSDVDSIIECLRLGAIDFIRKPFSNTELAQRIEVNLMQPRFAQDPQILREHLIDSLWENIGNDTGSKRGPRLEQLLKFLFDSIPFFTDIKTNLRAKLEEIDIEMTNRASDTFWRECGAVLLTECKNWSPGRPSVGVKEFDHFHGSLRRRTLSRIGFFVSYSGFSPEFLEVCRSAATDGGLVVPIDRLSLQKLVESSSRIQTLEDFIRNAGH